MDVDAHDVDRSERPTSEILDALVSEARGVLGDDLVGLHLYGSVVTGGFDAGVSDIDLIAVTASEVEALRLVGLEAMHRRFVDRNPEWRDRVEIVYIGRTTFRSFRTSPGSLVVISPGEAFHVRKGPDRHSRLVEMGESRTPRPEPFAGDHYERVRWFVVDRSNGHRHPAERSSHVSLDRA